METQFPDLERPSLVSLRSGRKNPEGFAGRAVTDSQSKRSPKNAVQPDRHHLDGPHIVSQGGNLLNKSPPRKGRVRANSLRRVKDSSEVLRQRSLKRSNTIDVAPEAIGSGIAGGREARHFTVGNVGHNGKMYLKPTNQSIPHVIPFMQAPTAPSNKQFLRPEVHHDDDAKWARHSMWSNSQLSELRPSVLREVSKESYISKHESPAASDGQDSRRHSLDIPSSESRNRKELRIVIERPETARPKSAGPPAVPALEIPIPHYRLGGFRFTSSGNPTLRSSAYTRTSVSDNLSTLVRNEPNNSVPPTLLHDALAPHQTHSLVPPVFTSPRVLSELPLSSPTQTSVFYRLREPIEPSIFEHLAYVMDDPSVVRYVKGSTEISAATPARIVAQISSDSFMDYELVSDFFLTFRSYLSPSNLLSLLLARLQWAINRPEDDGRIIRIRAFAALRHWILNYFVDDFVINRDLRVQFCQRLNQIYENVKACSNNSASDLKILLDLKRCWNGRCSLYWDSPHFFSDTHPDDKVAPGGVAGSRDAALSRLSEVRSSRVSVNSQPEVAAPHGTLASPAPIRQKDKDVLHARSHTRNISTTSARDLPSSTDSVRSIQAASCSLPSRGGRRGSTQSSRPKGPHPVLVSPSQRTSPASPGPLATVPVLPIWRRPAHSHKRSGSFSDSVRDDRAPLPSLNLEAQRQSLLQAIPHAESIIRGNVYAPVDPFVPAAVPSSPTMEASQFDFLRSGTSPKGDSPSKSSPGVKTFIGSIRRALSGRQSGNSPVQQTETPPPLPSLRGKTSALPLNVGFGSDAYRERRAGSDTKPTPRVDALCQDALQCYRTLVLRDARKAGAVVEDTPAEPVMEKSQVSTDKLNQATLRKHGLWPERVHSQITAGSKSIVIVDDTRFGVPLMSGAVPAIPSPPVGFHDMSILNSDEAIEASSPISHPDTLVGAPGPSFQHYDSDSISTTRYSRNSQDYVKISGKRSSSLVRSGSKTPVPSAPGRLRKYASYHSGMVRYGTDPSIGSDSESSLSRASSSQGLPEKPLARMLRRRPGGDLRKIQNVHDLQAGPRIRSYASGTSYTESMGESVLYIAGDGTARASIGDTREHAEAMLPMDRYSVVGAQPSQHLRSSFEAAIAGFAEIPDDDDGGIESTLLKLEGKWEKPSPITPTELNFPPHAITTDVDTRPESPEDGKKKIYRHQHLGEPSVIVDAEAELSAKPAPGTESFIGSEDSYCSIPLLERGLSDDSMKSPTYRPSVSLPQPLFNNPNDNEDLSNPESSHPSIDMVMETESLKRIPQGSTVPKRSSLNDEIEDKDNDYSSELSSEISVIDRDEVVDSPFGAEIGHSRNMTFPTLGVHSHPLTHPPSPPMTLQHPGSTSSYIGPGDPAAFQRRPITPGMSPIGRNTPRPVPRKLDMQHLSNNVLLSSEVRAQKTPVAASPSPQHAPFVLACESLVLAQQFTLVEKAALNEVDWKDLVDMRWSHCSQSTLNWADYLSQNDRKGIDIVVARFNLMVKWAVSEVVLTRNINERAQTIIKLIHVAVHARKLRNYSTMLQITIALSSVDCTRLVKTWELVPGVEKQLLRDMESLIQPIRNFGKLRLEMETTNLQDGCIPFVGLYVQDLTYNSQKPAQIASTRDGEPLVNFERYRTAATIVKSLLRLIDASTKYTFEPVYGIIERCLWISAISDEKIVALSKSLE